MVPRWRLPVAAAATRDGGAPGPERQPLRVAPDRGPRGSALNTAVVGDVALSFEDVCAAAARLAERVHHTPCWKSRTFSDLAGCRVWLKYENLQRTGSYKI